MRFHFVAAVLIFTAALARAESAPRLTPPDPIADRLVAEALEKTPEIAAARATTEAAKGRVEPASAPPDPTFSFTYQNEGRAFSLGDQQGSFLGLMATQPILWPGKLSLAGQAAGSTARQVEIETTGRVARTIEARVRSSWYDFVLAHATEHLLDHHTETARQIEETVRQRYAAGLTIQQDVLRADVELAKLEEARIAQHAAIVSAAAGINRLTGRAQDAPLDPHADLPPVDAIPAAAEVISVVNGRSPELAAAQQAIETGRIGTEIARKNFYPDFSVSAGSMYRNGFEMGPMWQVGVGISLPVWTDRRQQNQLTAARADVAARNAERDVVAQQLELRTRERLAQLEAAQRIVTLYSEKVIPLDELSFESARASYTAGKVPFITVLEALDSLYGDRTILLQRTAEAAKWRVAIDEASLEPTPLTGATSMPSSARPTATQTTPVPSAGTTAMTSMR
ncbi:MAG TPA: TolC family protein [Thermoanaerobaculia bacterium]|nr:TolC family protein [Thermoanaerobaculia bacterium]